jgi:hypothetical protein
VRRERRRQRTAVLALFVLILLTAALVATASAQEVPNPDDVDLNDPGHTSPDTDTEYTPVAKETPLWTRVAGVEYPERDFGSGGSSTALSADLFAVSFRNLFNGFFGGNRCEDREADWDTAEDCNRVPVIYGYTQEAGHDGVIDEVYAADGPGYVASIAWLGPDQALAVGGTGTYPRREQAAVNANVPEEDPTGASVTLPEGDPAGEARVWLYGDGDWRELGPEEIPDGMGALTAVDASPEPSKDCGTEVNECAFVGGLRQLWRWEDGTFVKEPFTPTSTDENDQPNVTHGADWLFRVRQIRFSPGDGPAAVAVTSGCCDLNPANEIARVLVYDTATKRWDVRLLYDDVAGAVGKYETLPDSYYGLTFAGTNHAALSVLATPGGPDHDHESASRILGPRTFADARLNTSNPDPNKVPFWAFNSATGHAGSISYAPGVLPPQGNSDVPYELAHPVLSSARLTAGDGDVDGATTSAADGQMDWAVGELRSGGQAIAYSTAARGREVGDLGQPLPLRCPSADISTECDPDPTATQDYARSRTLLKLPTYALNGFQLIGSSGVGWAVGDKGAIVRLGGQGTVGSVGEPPPPPPIGSSKRVSAPPSEGYDAAREAARGSGPAGPVPALGARPQKTLDEPRFVPAGSPDTRWADRTGSVDARVQQIVMSRDGSEGWALGGNAGAKALTVYRYQGERWERCRTEEVPEVIEADPACEELAALSKAGIIITAAARVPLERDSNPTNDDELEIVGAGSIYKDTEHPGDYSVMLSYRDGRWSIDWDARDQVADAAAISDIAFTRPDDGWLLAQPGNEMAMYHFNGERWTDCNPNGLQQTKAECADADGLLPFRAAYQFAPPHLALAGERLYLYGARQVGTDQSNSQGRSPRFPFVLYKDSSGSWRSNGGGYDPGSAANPDAAKQGELYTLSIVQDDGKFSGWALGRSNDATGGLVNSPFTSDRSSQLSQGPGTFLQLKATGADWTQADGAQIGRIREYLPSSSAGEAPRLQSFVDPQGTVRTVLAMATSGFGSVRPLMTYEGDGTDAGGWRVMPTPFTMAARGGSTNTIARGMFEGDLRALAPDASGGLWIAAVANLNTASTHFYRWSDREPAPVFDDVAHPIREPITAGATGPDGRLWVATASNHLYIYDRVTGWDSVRIGGWDRGQVVTRTSRATAVAVGPDGGGVVVGENGRIAEIDGAGGVTLNRAVTLPCGGGPCSTTQTLRAAAVAPDDGSALVGGDRRAVSWQPANGEFRTIAPPPSSLGATITGISMPDSQRAWLATNTGDIFSGNPAAGDWTLESLNSDGERVAEALDGNGALPIRAISVDANGHGYAVGDDGLLLERDPLGGATPWHRIDSGHLDDFQSLFYEPGGATLIGGESGLILTGGGDSFQVAHEADYFDPFSTATAERSAAKTVAVTAASGPGGTEGWGLTQAVVGDPGDRSPAPGRVLHFSSDPSNPLLSAGGQVEPLPDAPAPDADDLSVAAFGKSDCHFNTGAAQVCPEPTGSNLANERVADQVRDEILARSEEPGGPQLALFTGDVDQVAGSGSQSNSLNSPIDPSTVHHRWWELFAEPFADAGVPLFGAIGGQDLSHTQACAKAAFGICASTHDSQTGPNLAWRTALAGMPAPWGGGTPGGDLGVLSVSDSDPTVEGADITVTDPTGAVGDRTVPGGGAHTHYAFDVVRAGKKLARVAVLDTSLGSLAASDPIQNPAGSAQLKWLSDVLCRAPETTATGETCSREPGQRAIVVSNTPTYSFGPGALSDTQGDGTALEAVLSAADVDLVVSGRMGWNAVYWSVAPGLHCPRPGDPQPDPNAPPEGPDCAATTDSDADALVADTQRTVGETVGGEGAGGGALPFVIASSAGGKFGPDGSATGSANAGFWRGYTMIHLDPETGKVSFEQRPVFDWIGIEAGKGATRTLRANKKLELIGYGREPVGMDQPARYDAINSHAITHRYDLLVADADRPWLPKEGVITDGCDPYDCLDGKVGKIDPTTGSVKAGNGNYERTFALATLSVGAHSASYPLTFEPRASFTGPTPPPPRVPAPPSPPANPPVPPQTTPPVVEAITPPVLPTLTAAQPPAPPTPPVPPPAQSQAPIDLNLSPGAIDVAPPTAVSQPPTPPVNPAPPGGARREARQRQAAAQKSGADSAEEGSDVQDAGGDLADSPNATGTAMTRHELTAITEREQPSAWARDALLGGGIGIAALVLALGLRTARPTPRRREPELPAPAWSQNRDRRRF